MVTRTPPPGGRQPTTPDSSAASTLIHDLQSLIAAGRALRRVKPGLRRPARRSLDWLAGAPHHVEPAEVGALIDLGLSDGAVAAYLLDSEDLAAPQRRTPSRAVEPELPSSSAPVLYRALGRVSAASMRHHARQLIFAARRSGDPEPRTSLAARAFALTEAAEALEARAAGAEETLRWGRRAEEYRTIAEALPPGTARETYLHLARAYDGLAERNA